MSKLLPMDPRSRYAVALAVVAALAALVAAAVLRRGSAVPDDQTLEPVAASRPAPTVAEYESSVRAALAPLIAIRASLTYEKDAGSLEEFGPEWKTAELPLATEAKAAVFAAVVPADQREAHLALAIALSEIVNGAQAGDAAVWTRGEAALDDFLSKNAWARE